MKTTVSFKQGTFFYGPDDDILIRVSASDVKKDSVKLVVRGFEVHLTPEDAEKLAEHLWGYANIVKAK